jgi:hypothetical protein
MKSFNLHGGTELVQVGIEDRVDEVCQLDMDTPLSQEVACICGSFVIVAKEGVSELVG